MDRLIEFAYTASISVGEKCVIHVMNGAVMYQIDSVVKACCDFLVQQLDPSNAIGIANFAEQIGCTELHQKAREYIYMNFSQVKQSFQRKHHCFICSIFCFVLRLFFGVFDKNRQEVWAEKWGFNVQQRCTAGRRGYVVCISTIRLQGLPVNYELKQVESQTLH